MSAAYEELVELLDERGIGYWTSEDQAVRLNLRGQVAVYRIMAGVEPETDLFQVAGRSPVLVPEGCRTAAAETIVRANYGLRLGKFELDFNDGEVRFQVAQILIDDAVGQDVIDRMISTTVNMLDTYPRPAAEDVRDLESHTGHVGRMLPEASDLYHRETWRDCGV